MTAEFDPRHNARIIVLQRLFEKDFKTSNPELSSDNYFNDLSLQEASGLDAFDTQLVNDLVACLDTNTEKIDLIITKLAPEWPITQISKIDLMILRMAIAEGFILKLTPQKVVINEAIELAKDFSNDQTRKFVSGVLGTLFINQEKFMA